MNTNSTFKKYQNFLRKLAWSYNKTTGLPYEDLFSEATIGYMNAINSYDKKKKVPIINWIGVCVNSRLNNFLRYHRNDVPTTFINEEMEESIPAPDDIEASETISHIMECLGEDAREICSMIFNDTKYGDMNGRKARGAIRRKLRKSGWTHAKIWNAFNELKAVLK